MADTQHDYVCESKFVFLMLVAWHASVQHWPRPQSRLCISALILPPQDQVRAYVQRQWVLRALCWAFLCHAWTQAPNVCRCWRPFRRPLQPQRQV